MRGLLLIGAMLMSAACQGSDPQTTGGATTTTPSTVSVVETVGPTTTAPPEPATTEPAPTAAEVTVEVAIDGDASTLTGLISDSDDPFGPFVSCSGSRAAFGTYSVLASDPSSDIRSVSVVTGDLVVDAGIHDANVRVEFADGEPIDATGTITLAPDFRSGSFITFGADGTPVEGRFACTGSVAPEPLVVGADDGALEAVEVFALLRSGSEQRLVGLGAVAGAGTELACPNTGGDPDGSIIRVQGDEDIGAITEFELTAGSAPALTMQVGATEYAFVGVTVGATDAPGTGSFSASGDGLSVDGAYRCS